MQYTRDEIRELRFHQPVAAQVAACVPVDRSVTYVMGSRRFTPAPAPTAGNRLARRTAKAHARSAANHLAAERRREARRVD